MHSRRFTGVYNVSCTVNGDEVSPFSKQPKTTFEVYGPMNVTGLSPSQVEADEEGVVEQTVSFSLKRIRGSLVLLGRLRREVVWLPIYGRFIQYQLPLYRHS